MMVAVTVAIALAATGVAENLIGFFTIVGASFGPICGAMTADYLLSGKKWAGPREGVSVAGYGAWALGFLVGILPFLPVSPESEIGRSAGCRVQLHHGVHRVCDILQNGSGAEARTGAYRREHPTRPGLVRVRVSA